jgi:ribonucleoside-diphosphate reductase alpha chain
MLIFQFIGSAMIVKGLRKFLKMTKKHEKSSKTTENEVKCPICESKDVIIEGRCYTCPNCGWSKCDL